MEKLKYTTEKPKDGEYYFLPTATEVVFPDGIAMRVEWMPDFDEDGEPVEGPPGTVFFGDVREWIPEEDAKKGIYVKEEDYERRKDELDALYRSEEREREKSEGEDAGDDGDALKKVAEALSAISGKMDGE